MSAERIPMTVSVSTDITLDERFFGAASMEQIENFRDKVSYLKGVSETILYDHDLTITFTDTLPGDAKRDLARFIKGHKL